MSLDFELLVACEGVHDHLDGAWLVGLIDTGEEGSSIEEHFDLVQIYALIEDPGHFALTDLSD